MARLRTFYAATAITILIAVSACGSPPTPGMDRGEALFGTCVPCHGSDGGGNEVLGAPAIAGLPQWYIDAQLDKYQSSQRGANPFDTVGLRMKSMSRTLDLPGDLESVSEYVASMPVIPVALTLNGGSVEAGQQAFGLCGACHGAAGDGMEVLGAPPLTGQHDWYLLAQLQKFKTGWRGTAPGDVGGATMRANALTMDDQAMRDVVAYIQTLN